MSVGTEAEWLGGISIGNWYVEWLRISHFNRSASITEYLQGMMYDVSFDILPHFDPSKKILMPTPLLF